MEILLVGCPESYAGLLPSRADGVMDETAARDPLVIVVGPQLPDPLVTAQALASTYAGAPLVIAAAAGHQAALRPRLQTLPYVPIHTKLVPDDPASVKEAIEAALVRAEVKRANDHVLARASSALEQGGVQETVKALQETSHELQLVRRHFEDLYANAPDVHVSVEPGTGTVVECNRTLERQLGHRRTEVIGKPMLDLFHADCHPEARHALEQLSETGELVNARLQARHANGHAVPVLLTASAARDHRGGLLYSRCAMRDISAQASLEAELQRTVDELRRSNEDLEHFAYVASHDLQEPLRIVNSFLQLLLRQHAASLDGQAVEYIDFACEGANRMKTLIDDLLTYSRAGHPGAAPACCEPGDIVADVLRDLSLAIQEAGASVTCAALPAVWANAGELRLVIQNLLSNAIKFRGEAAPRVEFAGERTGAGVRITVQDNGIGFDADQAKPIFKMFQRLHARSRYAGNGIGLATCKRIMDRQGGRIWAEARPEGGARFVLELPAPAS